MDTESLKLFCDITRLKSFTRAAAIHSLSQSAASQKVKALEKHFGVLLIERRGREIYLTAAGEIVFHAATQILTDLQNVEDNLTRLRGKLTGHVNVAAIYSVGLYELVPFLNRFLSSYPEINVEVDYSRATKIYQDVESGIIDLGIVAYPVDQPKIVATVFREDELCLVCSPDHPFARCQSVSFKDFALKPFVTFHRDIPTRKAIDRIMKEYEVSMNVKAEFDNIELIKRAVEINLGISVLPSIPVMSEVQSGTLMALPLVEGPFKRPIGVLYRRGRSLPSAVRKFLDVLLEQETRSV